MCKPKRMHTYYWKLIKNPREHSDTDRFGQFYLSIWAIIVDDLDNLICLIKSYLNSLI